MISDKWHYSVCKIAPNRVDSLILILPQMLSLLQDPVREPQDPVRAQGTPPNSIVGQESSSEDRNGVPILEP